MTELAAARNIFAQRETRDSVVQALEGDLVLDLTRDPPRLLVSGETADLLHRGPISKGTRFTIRVFDLMAALPLLVVSAPVVLIAAAAIRTTSDGPVFYRSHRITRGGEFFTMWKLRTMRVDGDELLVRYFAVNPAAADEFHKCMKLAEDPRVTRVGSFLRRWSVDELPQLINVVLGEMSIVGPRPLLVEEAERLGAVFPSVVRVKGGITGLWQVSGRSNLTFEQRIPLDLRYVNHRSLLGDVKIVLITGWQVLRGRPGAY